MVTPPGEKRETFKKFWRKKSSLFDTGLGQKQTFPQRVFEGSEGGKNARNDPLKMFANGFFLVPKQNRLAPMDQKFFRSQFFPP